VSNDVIEALIRRLSPRAREVYDEIEKLHEHATWEGTRPEEVAAQAAALLDGLTLSERTDLLRILEAQSAEDEHQGRKPDAGQNKRAKPRAHAARSRPRSRGRQVCQQRHDPK